MDITNPAHPLNPLNPLNPNGIYASNTDTYEAVVNATCDNWTLLDTFGCIMMGSIALIMLVFCIWFIKEMFTEY